MSKVIDITEKLSFDENPKIKIKNVLYEVNADAATMLKIMQLLGDGQSVAPSDVVKMYELMFNEADRKKIDKLKLSFVDFQTIVMCSIDLLTGDSAQGE
jgi:hypothetical protein